MAFGCCKMERGIEATECWILGKTGVAFQKHLRLHQVAVPRRRHQPLAGGRTPEWISHLSTNTQRFTKLTWKVQPTCVVLCLLLCSCFFLVLAFVLSQHPNQQKINKWTYTVCNQYACFQTLPSLPLYFSFTLLDPQPPLFSFFSLIKLIQFNSSSLTNLKFINKGLINFI